MKGLLSVFALLVLMLLLGGTARLTEPKGWTDCFGVRYEFAEIIQTNTGFITERYVLVNGKLTGFERSADAPSPKLRVCIVNSQHEIDSYQRNWVADRYHSPDMVITNTSQAAKNLESMLRALRKK